MNVKTLPARKTLTGVALLAAGVMGGAAVATVGTANAASSSAPSATAATAATTDPGKPSASTETALTGSTLAKVKAAVLAKYAGATFAEVTTEDGGGYEAHITTKAGDRLSVLVSTAFAVTGTETHAGRGGHGMGSPTETALTGTTLAKVKAAVLAKYAGATFAEVTTEDGGGYEAHITTKAGDRLSVLVSTAFAVTGTETHAGHDGRGGHGEGAPGTTS